VLPKDDWFDFLNTRARRYPNWLKDVKSNTGKLPPGYICKALINSLKPEVLSLESKALSRKSQVASLKPQKAWLLTQNFRLKT
jgi:hypothetical protein